jgi:hypothetical protein
MSAPDFGEGLDTLADNVDRPDLYALRRTAGRLLPGHRVRHCGCTPRRNPDGSAAQIQIQPGQVSGLQTCGSPHVCPVCSLKIAKGAPGKAGRRDDVAACLAWMQGQGGFLVFFTLTLSHGPQDSLSDLVAAQRRAWRRMTQGKAWKALRGPYVRTWEATHGANGWHPHYHLTVLMKDPGDGEAILAEWIRCVRAEGMTAAPAGQDAQTVEDVEALNRYHVKAWNLADEHTNGLAKAGTGRSPWKLLAAAHDGDAKAAALFKEYAGCTQGRRTITYSRGLKAAAGVADHTDDELAAAEVDAPVMAVVDPALFKAAIRADHRIERELRAMSKAYHEQFGADLPEDWLEPLFDALGITYVRRGKTYLHSTPNCSKAPPNETRQKRTPSTPHQVA